MNYPIVFQITDSSAQDASYFYFATDVVLENSEPNRRGKMRKLYDIDASAKSEVCTDRRYPMNVIALDDYTFESIYNAKITYQCLFYQCSMGITNVTRNEQGYIIDPSDYSLNTKFPGCVNGILIGEKPGYVKGITRDVKTGEVTEDGYAQVHENEQLNVYMTKLKEMDVQVFAVMYDLGADTYEVTSLDPDEIAIITVTSKDKRYEQRVSYPFDPDVGKKLQLMLSDDVYILDIKVADKDGTLTGGLVMDWGPGRDNLLQNNQVYLYAIKSEMPLNSDEDFMYFYNKIKEKSTEFPPELHR